MEALTNFIKPSKDIKKVYLIDQDYSFGHSVADAAVRMLKEKRPDIQIVGNEFHPLVKVTDFSPYIAKIKASGADTVITGNWGQDFALLIKAAGDAGLKVELVHLLCRRRRRPDRDQAGRPCPTRSSRSPRASTISPYAADAQDRRRPIIDKLSGRSRSTIRACST